jgi:predicted DNA-binding antitoxin AbrB/MazE fold protein
MSHDVDAIYDHGVFRPIEPLVLPEGTRVHVRVESESDLPPIENAPAKLRSPRLAHPEQAVDFQLEVREATDATL